MITASSRVLPSFCTARNRAYCSFLVSHLGASSTSWTLPIPSAGLASMWLCFVALSQKAEGWNNSPWGNAKDGPDEVPVCLSPYDSKFLLQVLHLGGNDRRGTCRHLVEVARLRAL